MADVLPTPRATPEVDEKVAVGETRAKLEAALDELLKRYLLLLDQYIQARQQLSSDLSSSYISLAQANFNASNRLRYGQDFYDERMQALRRVTVEEKEPTPIRSIRLVDPPAESTDDKKKTASSKAKSAEEYKSEETTDPVSASIAKLDINTEIDIQSSAETLAPDAAKEKKDKADNKESKEGSQKARPDDPIRWFGILVPPALRSAQSTFVKTVEGPVPKLVNLAAEMRELEIEIGRARKAIRKNIG
ncbi:hypothetical protein GTA08_BOTSDO02220 [Botryosphaeria dothidea]|uniref:Vacuolar ATPase assembly protein VMA22 n=1 Tax=Botryosphaeria dothidea TaxID=55169 RepID=A0A8H4N627_9PEZI|nr:hypothetical protein GTA08_BOTSDO02220 [Botryosphaeria dothidea]